MTHKFMKMAGCKTEKEFYAKYPSENAFFSQFPHMKGNQTMKNGGAAIIPDNNPYGTGTKYVPVEYQQAQNGMMRNGGYLDFISYPEMPNSNMQYGGIQFIDDKRGYNQMQNPGHHWTNDGYKLSTGSTNNGASFSKFGGNISNGLPAPLEYAYLQDGGYVDQYHTGGQMQQGGFAANGPMIYDQTQEMKTGGIHIDPANKGKFTAYKQRTGKTTEEALHSTDPHVRKMAQFAKNAKGWAKKEFGGEVASKLSKFIKMEMGGKLPKAQYGKNETNFNAPLTNTSADQQDKEGFPQDSTAMGNAWGPSQSSDVTGQDSNLSEQDRQAGMAAEGSMPEQGRYEAAQGAAYDTTGTTDQQQSLKYTPQQNRQALGKGFNNVLGAGLQAASFFEDKNKQKNMAAYNRQQGMSDNLYAAQRMNSVGNKGDYNQSGVFRPNQNTPYMPGMQYPQMQMGGYKSGGEYELDDREIARLQKAGYKVQYL